MKKSPSYFFFETMVLSDHLLLQTDRLRDIISKTRDPKLMKLLDKAEGKLSSVYQRAGSLWGQEEEYLEAVPNQTIRTNRWSVGDAAIYRHCAGVLGKRGRKWVLDMGEAFIPVPLAKVVPMTARNLRLRAHYERFVNRTDLFADLREKILNHIEDHYHSLSSENDVFAGIAEIIKITPVPVRD